METTSKLALYQKMDDFITWIFPVIDRFPKFEKFALSSELKTQCYRLVRIIVRTNKSRDKLRGWYEVDVELEVLKWMIRHTHARKYLSPRSYETAARKVAEMGRITGGLIKGTR